MATAGSEGIHLENRSGKILLVSAVDSLFFEDGLASWCTGQDDCGIALAAGEQRISLIRPQCSRAAARSGRRS